MRNVFKNSMLGLLACAIVFQSSSVACAATKTVQAVRSNNSNDSTLFYNSVTGVSGYTGKNLAPSSATEANFRNNTRTIKYWSSHGLNGGSAEGTPVVYGDGTGYSSGRISSAGNASYWKGGELEFVILAACRQLDGNGANPRATYAKAMTGSTKNLRVIAGYHEGAPKSPGDETIVNKLMPLLKAGESLKSAWITAHTQANWGTYLVLTHSGNAQYSRFPGFPGATYTRPTGTSILRFSSANPNGTAQTYSLNNPVTLSNGLIANTNLSAEHEIPNYALKATPREIEIDENAPVMVYRDENAVTVTQNEIGDTVVDFDADHAIIKSEEWLGTMVEGLEAGDLDTYEISPLVMAEVNLEGGPEVEETIGYTVRYFNTYNNYKIDNNGFVTIVDNEGVNTAIIDWADFEEVRLESETIGLNQALDLVGEEIQPLTKNYSQLTAEEKTVEHTELIFSYDEESGLYKPSWKIDMQSGDKYTVNCVTGEVVQ